MKKVVVNPSDWMGKVADDKLISEINIPGTHDSAAQFVAFPLITRTQSMTVADQLEIGVRYFDFRFIKTANGFVAAHGKIYCKVNRNVFAPSLTAKEIADCCIGFLEKHPNEAILFQLKEDSGGAGKDFYTEFYSNVIKENEEKWFLENRIPTLGEARGKIVLLRVVSVNKDLFSEKDSGIDMSSYPYVGSKKVYDYRLESISELNGKEYAKMFVQDSYKLQMKKKWNAVKGFFESDPDGKNFNICFLSCTGFFLPFLNAKYVNKKFLEYSSENKVHGIIAMDYADEEICEKIYSTN